jgi:hypothetical protein
MSRIKVVIAMAAGSLFACGCGGPPGAGTVNMSAIKAASAQRGLPEAKARAARSGPDKPLGPARSAAPAGPVSKGRR